MLLSIRRFSDQAQATDLALTRRLRRLSDTPWVLAGFAAVSRLGDGLVWYLLMLALLLAMPRTSAWCCRWRCSASSACSPTRHSSA